MEVGWKLRGHPRRAWEGPHRDACRHLEEVNKQLDKSLWHSGDQVSDQKNDL